MTQPSEPANSNDSTPSAPPPLPAPLAPDAGIGQILETLLKRPSQLIAALHAAASLRLALVIGVFALLAFAAYGAVIGSFSGGAQLAAAPLKITFGALASMLICLPSLFIFACLTGAEVSLRGLAGALCAALALAASLLIGFAPVAWVFSQSTESVAFIGALHLVFWLISVGFGLRLLQLLMDQLQIEKRGHLGAWCAIFILVTLQMTTALRPIVGRSDHWLPTEKKFFAIHWFESIARDARSQTAPAQ